MEWKEADENGAVIEFYSLEARLIYNSGTTDRSDRDSFSNNNSSSVSIVPLKSTSRGTTSVPTGGNSPLKKIVRKRRDTKTEQVSAERRVSSSSHHQWVVGYDWNQVYSGRGINFYFGIFNVMKLNL